MGTKARLKDWER
jgi:hypothetical protein